MNDKVEEIISLREEVKTIELDNLENVWNEIPWYYRVALHIANHLLIYLPLTFCLGVFVGINAGWCNGST